MSDVFATVMREIEEHVAQAGWDAPARLFALVSSEALIESDPHMAAELGISADDGLTPVEQDAVPTDRPIDEFLAHVGWPESVVGAVLAIERLVLPTKAEAEIADADDLVEAAMSHPLREEVRIVVGVLADGQRLCLLRMRKHDEAESVSVSPDLAPGLADAIAATFED